MPIEIRIKDVYNLKLHEIEHLYKYLKEQVMTFEPPTAKESEDTLVPVSYLLPREAQSESYLPKTRKKRTPKPPISEDVPPSPMKTGEYMGNGQYSATPFTHEELNEPDESQDVLLYITYDDLIAYVLENTRTKKLTFDQVMVLVERFNVPSVNKLSDYPHLIVPFYNALEEIINDD